IGQYDHDSVVQRTSALEHVHQIFELAVDTPQSSLVVALGGRVARPWRLLGSIGPIVRPMCEREVRGKERWLIEGQLAIQPLDESIRIVRVGYGAIPVDVRKEQLPQTGIGEDVR